MIEEVNSHIQEAKDGMEHALGHLADELGKVRTGKASPAMVGSIFVNYYGSPTPLNQVANVSTQDARTIVIQPWEKNMLGPIEKAIFESNLGMTPMNDGEVVRLNVPPLTEERRRDMVKMAKGLGEEAKVSIRNSRHKAMDFIKKAVKDGFPEDNGKRKEGEVQDLTNKYSEKVDHLIEVKEKEIMTV
ncbi:MAG: ribosome recycling factor [Saprospiraceae bacterium]